MKLHYTSGVTISDKATGKVLSGLTIADAMALFQDTPLEYDRRKSFAKEKNREWADGIQW